MNPWYEDFIQAQHDAHDRDCADGEECETRAEHIERAFIRPGLKKLVENLQADKANMLAKLSRIQNELWDSKRADKITEEPETTLDLTLRRVGEYVEIDFPDATLRVIGDRAHWETGGAS